MAYDPVFVESFSPSCFLPSPTRTILEQQLRLTAAYTTTTMVQEIKYTTISHVIDSWEALKRMPDYEEKAGALLFQRYVCAWIVDSAK